MLFSVSHLFFYVVLIYGAIASDEEVFLITIYLRMYMYICMYASSHSVYDVLLYSVRIAVWCVCELLKLHL